MSAAFLDMVATAQAILAVEVTFVRVTTFILVILGNISEILNIVIFVQRTFRSNSCAIYFLAAACTRLIFINFTILPNGLSLGKLSATHDDTYDDTRIVQATASILRQYRWPCARSSSMLRASPLFCHRLSSFWLASIV